MCMILTLTFVKDCLSNYRVLLMKELNFDFQLSSFLNAFLVKTYETVTYYSSTPTILISLVPSIVCKTPVTPLTVILVRTAHQPQFYYSRLSQETG